MSDSFYIHARVIPGSKKEECIEVKENYFKVLVREKAKQNMANKRMVQLLQGRLNASKISIVNGHHNPSKLLRVDL